MGTSGLGGSHRRRVGAASVRFSCSAHGHGDWHGRLALLSDQLDTRHSHWLSARGGAEVPKWALWRQCVLVDVVSGRGRGFCVSLGRIGMALKAGSEGSRFLTARCDLYGAHRVSVPVELLVRRCVADGQTIEK
jgi:hypothetical protein